MKRIEFLVAVIFFAVLFTAASSLMAADNDRAPSSEPPAPNTYKVIFRPESESLSIKLGRRITDGCFYYASREVVASMENEGKLIPRIVRKLFEINGIRDVQVDKDEIVVRRNENIAWNDVIGRVVSTVAHSLPNDPLG
jgi:hypothetical protein